MDFITSLKEKVTSMQRSTLIHTGVVFLLGALFVFCLRFILVEKISTHYHANFAVYVNGEREKFDDPSFYEEVSSCSVSHANPKAMAHMHDNVSHVVHVHDDASTWGLFFQNLSFGVSREALLTDAGLFVDGQDGNKLTYLLNGQIVSNIAGRVIGSEDVLLVDYGKTDTDTINSRYEDITRDAGEYNKRNYPSACTGSKTEPFKDRLLRTIGIETAH
ncbi:MAG: hypothetical protein WAQ57_01510 [Candidatus Saccharimonadales bacterium]